MNCKLHTRRNILSLLASFSFLIFLDAGEDSSLLGLLVLGPKGDHHGEVWLHAVAHMAPVVGDHGVGPPSVSVHIPRSRVPAARASVSCNYFSIKSWNVYVEILNMKLSLKRRNEKGPSPWLWNLWLTFVSSYTIKCAHEKTYEATRSSRC